MPTYEVALTETRVKTIEVFASSEKEAGRIAEDKYYNHSISFNDADFDGLTSDVLWESDTQLYLYRFLRKGDDAYTHQFVVKEERDAVREFHEINSNEDILDAVLLEVPTEVCVLGEHIDLVEYDRAMDLNPDWTYDHRYLW